MNFKMIFRVLLSLIIFNFPPSTMAKTIDNLNDQRVKWIPFSDQVMGGISEVNFLEKEEDGLSFYHMEGNVSTENNGGFIQFRAEIEIEDKGYKGLKIKTRGNGEEYYLFIRTTKTRLPWLYYGSSFSTTDQWQWIEIPFSSFKKSEGRFSGCLLYTSPSPRDLSTSRMPSSA